MERIYLDYQATTPCDPRVVAAMAPYWESWFGNAHSEHHAGRAAADAVERARADVAALIGAQPQEIVFTSGATESNNLAIKGAARHLKQMGDVRRRVVTVATEHKCVLESVRDLEAEGFEGVVVPVNADGFIDLVALDAALAVPTLLLSVMGANNETGIVQDIPMLARRAREAGALFHTDYAQAAGRVPLDVRAVGVDLVSLSGHKIYGPKGIGALFVRRRPRVRLAPLFSGGGQERGLRSGTLPVPLIVGMGVAARLMREEGATENARLAELRDGFLTQILRELPGVRVNGAMTPRLAGNLNLQLPDTTALDVIAAAPELALSTGSACSSATLVPSYVLSAMGLSDAQAARSLRLAAGRFTSARDMARASEVLVRAVQNVRQGGLMQAPVGHLI